MAKIIQIQEASKLVSVQISRAVGAANGGVVDAYTKAEVDQFIASLGTSLTTTEGDAATYTDSKVAVEAQARSAADQALDTRLTAAEASLAQKVSASGTVANALYATNAGTASVASSVAGANVTGAVSSALYATSAASAGTATSAGTITLAASANAVLTHNGTSWQADNTVISRLAALESASTATNSNVTAIGSRVTSLEGASTATNSNVTAIETRVTSVESTLTGLNSAITSILGV